MGGCQGDLPGGSAAGWFVWIGMPWMLPFRYGKCKAGASLPTLDKIESELRLSRRNYLRQGWSARRLEELARKVQLECKSRRVQLFQEPHFRWNYGQ